MNSLAEEIIAGRRLGSREEALPLGNGRLGAMVWSGVDHETLSLNEDSLWSGYPKCADIPGAVEYYKQAQQLAREKKYSEAQELLDYLNKQ